MLPNDWKTENIRIKCKKGNRKLAQIYGPLRLTSIVCKNYHQRWGHKSSPNEQSIQH